MKWCGARTATGRGVCGARGATATGWCGARRAKGNGNIVMYVKLTVTFTNHVDNQVIDASGMPADMVRDASGTLMCQWGWV